MSNNSVLTCNKFLEAIFEQIRPHADNPEEFTSEWKRITGELDNKVKELERSMSERDELVRELLILMRTQLVKRTEKVPRLMIGIFKPRKAAPFCATTLTSIPDPPNSAVISATALSGLRLNEA